MISFPNTTPVPNDIINGWAMKLKGSELKVLLLVVRKTLGWIEDPETGMRKEEDWITYRQLQISTGLSTQPLSDAIDALVKYDLIQIRNKDNEIMDTKEKRQLVGKRRGKLFYRLNLTTLKTSSHYFENSSSTTLKIKDNKSNSYKSNCYKRRMQQKISNKLILSRGQLIAYAKEFNGLTTDELKKEQQKCNAYMNMSSVNYTNPGLFFKGWLQRYLREKRIKESQLKESRRILDNLPIITSEQTAKNLKRLAEMKKNLYIIDK